MEENYQIIDDAIQEPEELHVNQQSKRFLNETRKWAKFLAIMLFIVAGFMIIIGLVMLASPEFMGDPYNRSMGSTRFASLIFLVFSALYIIPGVYLLNFSKRMKVALYETNNQDLESAFKNLKSHYKFIGISLIVFFGFYILFAIVMGIVGAGNLFNV